MERDYRSTSTPPMGGQAQGQSDWSPQVLFSHSIETIRQLETLNDTGGIPIDFMHRTKAPIHLAFDGARSEIFSFWRTQSRFGFISTPKFTSDIFTLRFVTSGAMLRNNHRGEAVIGRHDRATLIAFEDMRDDRASADFSAISVTLTRQSLIDTCAALSGDPTKTLPAFAPVVDVNTLGLIALRGSLESLHRRFREDSDRFDMVTPLLAEILAYQLVCAWPTIGDTLGPNLKGVPNRSVRLAVDYMEANLSRRMTIAEIANAAGVGIRALQIAFKRHFGCSPVQYLIDRRLDRVHAALTSSTDLTVRQIASHWGFTHMSDFGRRYRQRYGQTAAASR